MEREGDRGGGPKVGGLGAVRGRTAANAREGVAGRVETGVVGRQVRGDEGGVTLLQGTDEGRRVLADARALFGAGADGAASEGHFYVIEKTGRRYSDADIREARDVLANVVSTVVGVNPPVAAEALGQSVVIVNQPGASGSVGTKSAWDAPHDGYTWAAGAASDLGTSRPRRRRRRRA